VVDGNVASDLVVLIEAHEAEFNLTNAVRDE